MTDGAQKGFSPTRVFPWRLRHRDQAPFNDIEGPWQVVGEQATCAQALRHRGFFQGRLHGHPLGNGLQSNVGFQGRSDPPAYVTLFGQTGPNGGTVKSSQQGGLEHQMLWLDMVQQAHSFCHGVHTDQRLVQGDGEDVLFAQGRKSIRILGKQGLLDALNLEGCEGFQPSTCAVHAHLAERPIGIHAEGKCRGRTTLSHGLEHAKLFRPIMSAHFAFEGGEALGDELVKLLHHVGDFRHPNQAIDVKALLSSCEGGFSHHTASPAMQVPSSGFDRKTHCRKGSGHGHGVEASTAGHPLQFCLRLFLGLRREAKNEAAFSHTDLTMVIFCDQKPCGLFRQGVP